MHVHVTLSTAHDGAGASEERSPRGVGRSRRKCNTQLDSRTCAPAASVSETVRTAGSALPSATPSTTATWLALPASYLGVRSHSYVEKYVPGLITL